MRPRQQRSTINLALMLGWQDLRQTYRRSVVGPFWITIGMGLQIATMGVVFGLIFKTPSQTYLPFLASSIVIWGFIATAVTEGCMSFIQAEGIIKQLKIPLYVHILRTLWKSTLTFGHNLVILPVVFLIVMRPLGVETLLFPIGLVLLILNLAWIMTLLGLLSARYRDLPPIVSSLMTIAFYVTPVMWVPNLLPDGTAHLLLGLNPLYHLIQIVRLPLLGELPTSENWMLAALLAFIGWIFVGFVMKKFKSQIAFWV